MDRQAGHLPALKCVRSLHIPEAADHSQQIVIGCDVVEGLERQCLGLACEPLTSWRASLISIRKLVGYMIWTQNDVSLNE